MHEIKMQGKLYVLDPTYKVLSSQQQKAEQTESQ